MMFRLTILTLFTFLTGFPALANAYQVTRSYPPHPPVSMTRRYSRHQIARLERRIVGLEKENARLRRKLAESSSLLKQMLNFALITAIKQNDTEKALTFLAEGADPNATDQPSPFLEKQQGKYVTPSTGPTALYLACAYVQYTDHAPDNWKLVKALLERGAKVNVTGDWGRTPLLWAANLNKSKVCQLLIERGANVNPGGKGDYTPLVLAASHGDLALVRLLINKGANVNAVGSPYAWYETPLVAAQFAEGDDPSITKLLLSKRAKITMPKGYDVIWTWTPLSAAIYHQKPNSVRILLEHRAEVNPKTNYAGISPLKEAEERGNQEIIQMLKQAGAKE